MNITELPNGRYRYVEYFKDPYTNKKQKRMVTLDKNTKQAQNQAFQTLQNMIAEAIAGKTGKEMRYSHLLEEYKNDWLPRVKHTTKRNCLVSDKHIEKVMDKDTIITKIDKKYVRKLMLKISQEFSHAVADRMRKRLHAVFNYAVNMDYITINPFDNISLPKQEQPTPNQDKLKFLSFDEIKAITEKLEENDDLIVARCVKVLALTGMRYGELAALTIDKIDFKNNLITINETYDFNLKKKTGTKTDKSNRVLSVSQNIMDTIREQMEQNAFYEIESDYIFCNNRGLPIANAYINKRLKKYANISTHTFRHSHISFLTQEQVPLKAIMDRVGHANPKTTLAIYSHTTEMMKTSINDTINNIAL